MNYKLKQVLEKALQESEVYIQKLNMIISGFAVIIIICSAYLFYSFNIWTLYCIVASVTMIVVAIVKKRKLFNDLTKIAESDNQNAPR